MAMPACLLEVSDQRKRWPAEGCDAAVRREERQTMDAGESRTRRRKPLDAGGIPAGDQLVPARAGGRGQGRQDGADATEAVQWSAAAHLIPQTSRTRCSESYASNQYRALQQFFKWWAQEEELPDPMARLRPPRVTEKLIPVFTRVELSKLERACQGRSFAQRRDAAIIAVFEATGIRLSELAGIRYGPVDAERSDLDLWQREITVRGKDGKQRIVKISYPAARTVDRYIRVRARHAQAWRPQLWLGVSNRGPMTAQGIYQMIVRRGCQCGKGVPAPVPAPLQSHLAGPRRRRG